MACSNKQTQWKVLSAGVQTSPLASFTASYTSTPLNRMLRDTHTPTSTFVNTININNHPSAPFKASVARGLQKTPVLPTLKLMLNTNGKRSASPIKTGGNCTPLGTINDNGRVKQTIIKSLKQQFIEAEAEWERRGNNRSSERAAINRTHSEAGNIE